ncbi:MAG: 4Fe-4S dicluster domain-containing protein [Caldilinea sp. CFX5]|nr:4Fe-4S dicluster domain-containing protein [Caldilinea sp. CFX5]
MTTNPLPIIDPELCDGCARCIEVCPTGALDLVMGKAELRYPDRCTYCTACEEACPTNAIVFGNVNDKNSPVYKIRNEEQTNRLYYALEQLHVLPGVSYLAKIRNTDRHVGVADEHHTTSTEKKEEAPAAH